MAAPAEQNELELGILTGRGTAFTAGGRRWELARQPLGGELLLEEELRGLRPPEGLGEGDPMTGLLLLAEENRRGALRAIARGTLRSRREHLDAGALERRIEELDSALDSDEIATLLAALMTRPGAGELMAAVGLDGERETQRRLGELRGAENGTMTFGGKTVFGRVIDAACSRYGWTYEYAVWGISLDALRMMLGDQTVSVSVSDDERRKLRLPLIGERNGEEMSLEELRALTEE